MPEQNKKTQTSLLMWLLLSTSLTAQPARASQERTPMLTGFLGLNTTPSARMDKTGTVRAGITTLDPYLNGYIGMQITKPLYIQIRQSAETSNILKDADRLYPGLDVKLRLTEENAYRPEIALGVQSAIGHRRMAGEFIAASKRYRNFDFTAGLGWGRYGTAAHIDNPFKIFGNHFKDTRNLNGEEPNTPEDWFTGDKIGLFGGIEYFLPVKGLSLKLDYGADRYTAEQAVSDFLKPSPWGLGISYAPTKWINAGFGIQGKDTLMGRISLSATPEKWSYNKPYYFDITKSDITDDFTLPLRALPTRSPPDDYGVDQIYMHGATLFVTLHIPENISAPAHIRRVIDYIELEYQDQIEHIKEYAFTLKTYHLESTTMRFLRADINKTLAKNQSSPQEVWNNTEITGESQTIPHDAVFLPKNDIDGRNLLHIQLDNQISLSEEDTGALYRTGIVWGIKNIPFYDTMNGLSLRFNIADNLDTLDTLRPSFQNPVRSDAADFTDTPLSIEHSYIGFTSSFTPNLHFMILSGYLEEFYAATGGEILYRPHDSRLAVGAEFWHADKRVPDRYFNATLSGQRTNTAFANLWYDLPNYDLTANLRAGRFLGEDTGFEFGLEKRFNNGAKLEARMALSNAADPDIFGDKTHAMHSLSLILPWGTLPTLSTTASIKTRIAPFARNAAQSLNKPISLYEITEPFTLDHLSTHWNDITDN